MKYLIIFLLVILCGVSCKEGKKPAIKKYDTGYYNAGKLWRDMCDPDTLVVRFWDANKVDHYLNFARGTPNHLIISKVQSKLDELNGAIPFGGSSKSSGWGPDTSDPPLPNDTPQVEPMEGRKVPLSFPVVKIDSSEEQKQNTHTIPSTPLPLKKP